MDKVVVVLASLGSFFILCQWYVFISLRKYLFGRYAPISRSVAYPVLAGLAAVNFLALFLSFNSSWLPPDSLGRKIAIVIYFSYLGLVLVLCLEFLLIGALSITWSIKDVLAGIPRRVRTGSHLPCADERGFVGSNEKARFDPALDEASRPDRALGPFTKDGAPFSATRRSFLKWTTAAGVTTALAYAGRGVAQGYRGPVVEELEYIHPLLTGSSRPITLLHVTDFHFGLFMGTAELYRLVRRLNEIDADALVITGDVFHSSQTPVEIAAPILETLRPREFGTYGILGNHDFYAGEWRSVRALKKSGITVLRNEWMELTHGEVPILLGGIDDPLGNWLWGKDFPNFRGFLKKLPSKEGLRILLSHRPNVLPLAAHGKIDLVLAGHIHAGQVILPAGGEGRGVSLASLVSPYTHGWYQERSTSMYLNRGIGLTFVPWRINCPPEIALIRLKGAEAATSGKGRAIEDG